MFLEDKGREYQDLNRIVPGYRSKSRHRPWYRPIGAINVKVPARDAIVIERRRRRHTRRSRERRKEEEEPSPLAPPKTSARASGSRNNAALDTFPRLIYK